jgi:hypothetical protein
MKWPTRLKPAPVPYPNGGGLKAMGTSKTLQSKQKAEMDALDAKHEADKAALVHKQAEERKPKAAPKPATKKASN